MLGIEYWLIPLVLGSGFLAAISLVHRLSRTRRLQIGVPVAAAIIAGIAIVGRDPLSSLWTRLIGAYPFYLYPLGSFDSLAELRPWIPQIAVAILAVAVAWIAHICGVANPRVLRDLLGPTAAKLEGDGLAQGDGLALGVVGVLCLIAGASADFDTYAREIATRSLATPADLTVLNAMNAMLPPGTLVLTDGEADAGMWVTALTDLTRVVPTGFDYGTLSLPPVAALAHACGDPGAAEAVLQRDDVVFVGSHRIADPSNPWNVDCIARLPDVRLITSAQWDGTVAAAFAIIK